MKYVFSNPSVDIRKVSIEGLEPVDGIVPQIGDYIVTDPLGYEHILTEKEVNKHFKMPSVQEDKLKQAKLKAIDIKDIETFLTGGNAEELLAECAERAKEIISLL